MFAGARVKNRLALGGGACFVLQLAHRFRVCSVCRNFLFLPCRFFILLASA
ncbi:hypothetical protein CYJ66_06420 [Gardnerella vaginalis]|uniref:Uncharacterized protein n=1 Tax=Gardnerella vaginalis (strain ATCC 14019 / 317) TaxID=525284 RepID=E3D7U9_GARV3|nr:hypothetical protein HMPREF0421_20171 [Gardnerella vaginalis ATCC 14019]AYZ21295.1 hypothetical protein EGX90_01655 [Gardnerella vaginalis]TCH82847.1 hypothetical protein E0E46_02150 [Gardnerella vaginalis ATCC 14018 = JCM 11026]PKY97373.1 hypothetical protein CYJ58_04860 [Gardnerella vaginalis]PKZ45497.1 hypothetical protein CYJ68_00190 [Gardnerella vaginalis]